MASDPTGPVKPESVAPGPSSHAMMLEGLGSMAQNLDPVRRISLHLNAFHGYSSDPSRQVQANHYCSHFNDDVCQCVIYDETGTRLIGVEYVIAEKLFLTLPPEERQLWHSHHYEVASGLLVMPAGKGVPEKVCEMAERKVMSWFHKTYGKTWHFWQVDRGDELPLGLAQLMISFPYQEMVDVVSVKERDKTYGIDTAKKSENRMSYLDMHFAPKQGKGLADSFIETGSGFKTILDPVPVSLPTVEE